jgi:hypothetical protein
MSKIPDPMVYFGQSDARVESAVEKLRTLLVSGETLVAWTAQTRFGAWARWRRRGIFAATTGRVIMITRKLFGGFEMADIQWRDLADARTSESYSGAILTIRGVNGRIFGMDGLDRVKTPQVYAACQAQEQIWREKTRIREIEDRRSAMAPVMVGSSYSGTPVGAPQVPQSDPLTRLKQAKEMLDQGLISDVEYEALKAKVIAGM